MPASDPTCSVQRKCSSVGTLCSVDDRVCQAAAVERGLEVICERKDPVAYVYCPPGAEQRDSVVVWLLLVVALVIATGGSVAAYFVFRPKKAS